MSLVEGQPVGSRAEMRRDTGSARPARQGVLRHGARFLHAVRKRALKGVAKGFPLNAVRVSALRAAGYDVGRDVYIGQELHVTDDLYTDGCHLSIGDRVAIAQRVLIVLSSHANNSRVAQHLPGVNGSVRIADDAWIGAGAIILPNVTIAEQAVVAAGSIVTKDVAAQTIVAGNPARVVRALVGDREAAL